jgi:Tfp pilus assembly protein PilN
MAIKELIGIYLGKDALYYCGAVRTLSAWKAAIPGSSMEPSGMIQGHFTLTLREFLLRISPKPGRRIYLALPRNRFFIRELQLPPLPLEDALMSVQSALPLTCHLSLEEIYYDIYLGRIPDGSIHALVIYMPRKEIAPVFELFREFGHEKSLAGLFPVSLGIGAWLNLQKFTMPMGLMISLESPVHELAVFHTSGCVYSVSWQDGVNPEETALIRDAAVARFQLPAESIYCLDETGGCLALPEPAQNKLSWLPSIQTNPGVAALSPALSDQQPIFVNGDPPRIKLFKLWKVFVPVVLLLTVVFFVWTVYLQRSVNQENQLVSAMKNETQQLQHQLRPLEKTRDALKKTESLVADIDDFVRLRPKLYSCFNEIAKLVPEGTWFSRCNLQGPEMSLQGQSKDALKVVESLRTSPLFEQVKMSGSVSRAPSGVEQFSLSIRLKDVEAAP